MTDLYIKQHVFTVGEEFTVYSEDGSEKYYVFGSFLSVPKTFGICSAEGDEVAKISGRLFSFPAKYDVSLDGEEVTVCRKISFLRPLYCVEPLGWEIEGDFFAHEYEMSDDDGTVATVSKEWFTFGDAYRLRVVRDEDVIACLCALIVIDACVAAENNN